MIWWNRKYVIVSGTWAVQSGAFSNRPKERRKQTTNLKRRSGNWILIRKMIEVDYSWYNILYSCMECFNFHKICWTCFGLQPIMNTIVLFIVAYSAWLTTIGYSDRWSHFRCWRSIWVPLYMLYRVGVAVEAGSHPTGRQSRLCRYRQGKLVFYYFIIAPVEE